MEQVITTEKFDFKGKSEEEMAEYFVSIGEKPFRAKQLFQWVYYKQENDFSKMTNLAKELRDSLQGKACISELKLLKKSITDDLNTEKYLYGLSDGHAIETVVMRYYEHLGAGRVTICISTQVGCAIGCKFCSSGCNGLTRNLTSGEIVDQVIQTQKSLTAETGERIANVVIMGIGEPLSNYENLVPAVKLIKDPHGLGIGHRHITISTCGLAPRIKKLAHEGLRCKLAISLHAYNDELRSKIMPVNNRYPIKEIIDATRYYQSITETRITFEYTLIKGLNDSIEGARQLGHLFRGLHCIVNIIPLNPVPHFPYEPSDDKTCRNFADEIETFGIKATVRNERGRNINAACGQLRAEYLKK